MGMLVSATVAYSKSIQNPPPADLRDSDAPTGTANYQIDRPAQIWPGRGFALPFSGRLVLHPAKFTRQCTMLLNTRNRFPSQLQRMSSSHTYTTPAKSNPGRPQKWTRSEFQSTTPGTSSAPTIPQSSPGASETTCGDGDCFVSIIENRAKEIGLAALDVGRSKIHLLQFIEASKTYTTAKLMLEIYAPRKLITVTERNEFVSRGLNRATREFAQVAVPRNNFDDAHGGLMLEKVATAGTKLDPEGSGLKTSHYLALGAAGALLKYVEEFESVVMMSDSVHVEIVGTGRHMQLDQATAESLELTKPIAGKNSPTLFKILNCTRTSSGARLLKANILQPLTDIRTLVCRYDCVEELVENEEALHNISHVLSQFPKDLDKMCGNLAAKPPRPRSGVQSEASISRRISSMIDSVLLLRDVLQLLGDLSTAMETCRCDLLCAICANCRHGVFLDLLNTVDNVLDDEARRSRSTLMKHIEQCYAVKSGMDGFLDMARTTFCRITEQIHELGESYKTQHGIESLKVSYNTKRGFHMITPEPGSKTRAGEVPPLPREFRVLEKRGRGTLHCTTHEMIALNSRLRDATNDCLILTQRALEGAVSTVLGHITLLQKLEDNIALLDMVCAFAHVVVSSKGAYSRPQLCDHGPVAIVQGRHPILEKSGGVEVQANDTYIAPCSSCHIITGPNMSGKSTYLKQVALILIMGQIGCFVPASYASFPPRDRLFSRMGTADSIETNSSSFMVEMQETAYMLENVTKKSLVIIDELGRATSTADGEAIAGAVCEKLIALGTYTLLATHFGRLPYLAKAYPNCRSHKFNVETSDSGLHFTWRLEPSLAAQQDGVHYGLMLAKVVSVPEAVISNAQRIADELDKKEKTDDLLGRHPVSRSNRNADMHGVYAVAQKLMCLADRCKGSSGQCTDKIKHHMAKLKAEAQAALGHVSNSTSSSL